MSLRTEFGATPGASIASGVDPVVNSGGATGVLIHVLTTSSLQFTAQIATDGSNYTSMRIINAKTGAETAAATNVTPSANDLYYIPVYGAEKLKIVRQAGSGTISFRPLLAGPFGVEGGTGSSSVVNLNSEFADDAAFTPGTSKLLAIGAMADETSPDSVDEGDVGIPRMGLDRILYSRPVQGNVTDSISVSAALPVGDEGNATVTLNGAAGVMFGVSAVSGLHVTVEARDTSTSDWVQVESYQIAGGYERHRKYGQDITLVAADKIFVPGDYNAVRLKRASGTSATVTTRTLGPGMVAKLLAAPIEYKPLTNQNIANGTLDDAGGTTLTVPTGAMGAWITLIETTLGTPAYVYMTTDGGTPSATDGSTLKCLNQPFELIGSDLIAAVKFLAVDAGSRLNAEFFEIVRRVG